MRTNHAAYIWGEILAALSKVHEFTPAELNKAVAYPLFSFGDLMGRLAGKITKEVDEEIAEALSKIEGSSFPENLLTAQQGDVWIGYYHHKKKEAM